MTIDFDGSPITVQLCPISFDHEATSSITSGAARSRNQRVFAENLDGSSGNRAPLSIV